MPVDIQTSLDFGSVRRILNLPTPITPGESATKSYVDSAVEGLAWKDNCRVATQANVSLASPGATIDGVTMVVNDRVLVRAQTTQSENGIYFFNGAAVPMTRSLDASTSDELEQAVTTVDEGTSGGSTFRQSTINFVLGTGSVVWVAFGTSAGAATESSAGIAEIATQAETDAGTDDARFVTPLKLKTSPLSAKRFSQAIGDGSATSYTVTHNFNSRNVLVEVYRNSGNYDTVLVETRRTSVNAVQLVFDTAPTSNAYQVVVTY